VAQLSPHEKEAHSQSLPFITFRVPNKGALLQVPLKELTQRGLPHSQSPFSSAFTSLGSVQLSHPEPLNKNPFRSPKLLSLLCSKLKPWYPLRSHEYREYYKVHQVEPPYLVRLNYLWEVAWYPRGCHLRQTHPLPFIPQARHSHRRIGDCFSRFTPLDLLCSV